MRQHPRSQRLTRRSFLKQSTAAVAVLAWTGGCLGAVSQPKTGPPANPFAYDVSRLSKTDPSLIGYQESHRFSSPHPEPRRIAIGPEDRLYLAAGHYVSILNGQGSDVSEIALSGPARCLAVSSEEEVFVGQRD